MSVVSLAVQCHLQCSVICSAVSLAVQCDLQCSVTCSLVSLAECTTYAQVSLSRGYD